MAPIIRALLYSIVIVALANMLEALPGVFSPSCQLQVCVATSPQRLLQADAAYLAFHLVVYHTYVCPAGGKHQLYNRLQLAISPGSPCCTAFLHVINLCKCCCSWTPASTCWVLCEQQLQHRFGRVSRQHCWDWAV
jgi:hypothetical protein